MRINSTPDNGTIIIWDWSNNSLEWFSDKADDYLQRSKNALPEIQQNILAWEENQELKDMPIPTQFQVEGAYRWWGLYIIKDKKLQDYKETLNQIITTFYSHIEQKMKKWALGERQFPLITNSIHQRKTMVTKAILDTIRIHQMDKLVHEYNDGQDKYDCSPMEIATINRWEKTYISHIFNPIADIEIISRVWGSYGRDRSIHHIYVSKDVFSPKNEINNGDNYLANLMGHETKKDLITAMKKWDKWLNEEGKKIVSLGSSIKRAKETN